jgi:DNA primase
MSSSNMTKALRTSKVLIDWSQNHEKKTTVAVYSLRAKRDEPYVSMPVSWDEVRRALSGGNSRLKPELVAQVEFVEWTENHHLRHSRFVGLRDDKEALRVTREAS